MNFNKKVYEIVLRIPKGKVATYGQIAALVGSPRAARVVGWAMHAMDKIPASPKRKRGEPPEQARHYPWWRVINSRGMISTTCLEHTARTQKDLLVRDGVEVKEREGNSWVDLREYLWDGTLQIV
jgi:methylated-DNA-protein-cysteine methyltransferase related protein